MGLIFFFSGGLYFLSSGGTEPTHHLLLLWLPPCHLGSTLSPSTLQVSQSPPQWVRKPGNSFLTRGHPDVYCWVYMLAPNKHTQAKTHKQPHTTFLNNFTSNLIFRKYRGPNLPRILLEEAALYKYLSAVILLCSLHFVLKLNALFSFRGCFSSPANASQQFCGFPIYLF